MIHVPLFLQFPQARVKVDPKQEFLILIISLRIAFVFGYTVISTNIINSGPTFETLIMVWLMFRIIINCELTIVYVEV